MNKFKTLRHIETVRNYLNAFIKEILLRQEKHDQSKLQSPEYEIFNEHTPHLRESTYDSDDYKYRKNETNLAQALKHHYANNAHHPEHFKNGINDMTLIDVLEMFADWKSSSLRHNDGNILISIEKNSERFHIDAQLSKILVNTAKWIDTLDIKHYANES
jgi:hypothetical protein